MVKDTDIAWLAGLLDGEGCIGLWAQTSKPNSLLARVEIGMSDKATVDHAAKIILEFTGYKVPQSVRYNKLSALTKRPQWFFYAVKKEPTRDLLRALIPYLVTKRLEALLTLSVLERSTHIRAYRATELDLAAARLVKRLKRDCGEARVEAEQFLNQVIPNQVAEGTAQAVGSAEGLESRGPSPNGNDLHECPTTSVLRLVDAGR